MPDVGAQLAEYFEAATERIDADDVFASANVHRQLKEQRAPPRQVRPAWAAAAGFFGVVLLVGGVMLSAWWAQRPDSVEPATFSAPVAEATGSWDWWPLVLAGGVVIAGAGVVLFLRRRRATKEVEMQKLDEKRREAAEVLAPRRSRQPWIIGLAALLVIAASLGAWVIVEANRTGDIEIATELVDAWISAWNAGDSEAVVAVFTDEVQEQELVTAERFMPNITNVVRTSSLVTTEPDKTYRYTLQFDWASYAYTAGYEVELDGDLLSRMESDGPFSPIDEVQLYSDDSEG